MARQYNKHEIQRADLEPTLTDAHHDVIEAHCHAILDKDWDGLYSSTCLPLIPSDLFRVWLPEHEAFLGGRSKTFMGDQFRMFRKRRWRLWKEWKLKYSLTLDERSTYQITIMLNDLLNTDKDTFHDYRVTGARLTDAARPRDRGAVSPLENLGREV